MQPESQFYCFREGILEPLNAIELEANIAAADSWLVEDGRVRSLEAHFARFTKAIEQVTPSHLEFLPKFFEAVTAALPREGRWFPRIEFHSDAATTHHLHLRLREAPDALDTISLWTLDEPDPRISPMIKGPDLSLGQQLRRRANLHGADEAVLLDSNGYISECALASLVWWRDDVLCAPGPETAWLDSVTRREIFAIAEQAGFQTRTEHVKPQSLIGLEIWVLSSLHGIREVTDWINLPGPITRATHADTFRRRLRLVAKNLG